MRYPLANDQCNNHFNLVSNIRIQKSYQTANNIKMSVVEIRSHPTFLTNVIPKALDIFDKIDNIAR